MSSVRKYVMIKRKPQDVVVSGYGDTLLISQKMFESHQKGAKHVITSEILTTTTGVLTLSVMDYFSKLSPRLKNKIIFSEKYRRLYA